jgi:hypothetical protein
MPKNTWILALIAGVICCQAHAVEQVTEHTLKLAKNEARPSATIKDMAWLAGHWKGSALGGTVEEIWSPAEAGGMIGMYRLLRDGKPIFYEILTIFEDMGSLLLKLKHFHPDLKGWEEKNETEDFPLVAFRDGVIHFDGMAFHPKGDELVVYLAIDEKDGAVREARFVYTRVRAQ